MNIYLIISLILNGLLIISLLIIMRKWGTEVLDHSNTLDEYGEQMKELKLVLMRENYLLKTMNDACKVVDTVGFMHQRMSNAPKNFKAKTKEEIKPDKV